MKQLLHSYQNPIPVSFSLSLVETVDTAIVPLEPDKEKILTQKQRLVMQTQRINQMAAELEAAVLELKAIAEGGSSTIATQINSRRRYLDQKQQPLESVCKYFTVGVPLVKQSGQSFLLTMRKIDLFRAEREATQLADKLRYKSRKKRQNQSYVGSIR
jgi:exonuclease VII small subunit